MRMKQSCGPGIVRSAYYCGLFNKASIGVDYTESNGRIRGNMEGSSPGPYRKTPGGADEKLSKPWRMFDSGTSRVQVRSDTS